MMAPNTPKSGSKQTKKQSKDPSNDFYVGLLESESIQRELLEAQKNSIILLKRLEKAVLLREQRLYIEGELRDAIGSLSDEIARVMKHLPDLPQEKIENVRAPKPKPAERKKAPEKPLSELDRKLSAIDKRLAELE